MLLKNPNTRFFYTSIALLLSFSNPTSSDPQSNLLVPHCSGFEDVLNNPFFNDALRVLSLNLNATLSDLRSQLNDSTRFATAQRPNIYALFQCRDYLSTSDCLSCFSTAASKMQRDCPKASISVLVYDGCFLRYGLENFFQLARKPPGDINSMGDSGYCGHRKASNGNDFNQTVEVLLRDLVAATPWSREFFAAAKREGVVRRGDVVYGVAQCIRTVSKSGCEDCLEQAFKDIKDCPPLADGRAVDVGCFLRFSDTAFFNDSSITDLAALLRKKGNKSKTGVIIGVVAAVLVLAGALIALWLLRRWKKAREPLEGGIIAATETELRGPTKFSYHELKSATKNFSDENKVGEGGFGSVYLGVMRNNKKVAVKRLSIDKSRRIQVDFEKEVKLINNVRHRNLVRLLGRCSRGPEYLLVYEYMANSSLDKYLFGNRRGTLNWKQRFDIIVGIARGLAYLHEEFHVCIIHRDIKSNNVLLDDEFQPKIADFGLARLLPADMTHLNTRFAGTLGYMAPEYAVLGKLTEKVDVYSYGMVVLEIMSSRKASELRLEPVTEYLLNWAWRLYEEDSLMDLVDKNLDPNEYDADDVKKVIQIALMCTQSVSSRPAMSEVVVWLLNKDKLMLKLTAPNFITATNTQNKVLRKDTSTSSGSSSSQATMSITQVSGR